MSCGLDICYCQSNSIIYNILYCFNTSHVTLYLKREEFFESLETSFNTSHVTLYQGLWTSWRPHQSFQYISCYSLSPGGEKDTSRTTVSIHLMLLFILLASWGIVEWVSFNTSHVTLYQHPSGSMTMARYVSIHLMLLFIGRRISDSDRSRKVSIHLMLLFIDNWQIEWILLSYVSIHLMLLFIVVQALLERTRWRFNTSHVTLYRLFLSDNGYLSRVSIHLMLLFIIKRRAILR